MKKFLLTFLAAVTLMLGVGALPSPAFAAWKYIGGAELNSITDTVEIDTNSAPIATSTTAHSGTYSWEVKNGVGFGRKNIYTSNQTSTSTLRVWVRPHAYPNASTRLIYQANTTNVFQDNITMQTDGTLVLLKASGVQIGSASAALPLDTWSCVEIMDEPTTGASGTLTARVGGVNFATGLNSAAGSWARVLFGNVTGAQTSNDVFFDDVVVTDALTGFAGCGSDVFMTPNATGDANAWTISGSTPAATNWQSVNTYNGADGVTLVKSKTSTQEDLYNFTNSGLHSYDTINALVVGTRYANDTADATTAFKAEFEAAASGNKFQSAATIPNSVTWATSYLIGTTTGSTGIALTSNDLDNNQAGQIISTSGTNFVQSDGIFEYADYTAGSPPAGTQVPALLWGEF